MATCPWADHLHDLYGGVFHMVPPYIHLGSVSYEEDILWSRGEAHIARDIKMGVCDFGGHYGTEMEHSD